jgi:hypothetical protein
MALDACYSCDAGGTKRKKPGRNIRRLPNASHIAVRGIRCTLPRVSGCTDSGGVNLQVRCCKPYELDAARNSEDFESSEWLPGTQATSTGLWPTLYAAGQSAESRAGKLPSASPDQSTAVVPA